MIMNKITSNLKNKKKTKKKYLKEEKTARVELIQKKLNQKI